MENEWEEIIENELYRIEVPSGWLYKTITSFDCGDTVSVSTALAFVPEPEPEAEADA